MLCHMHQLRTARIRGFSFGNPSFERKRSVAFAVLRRVVSLTVICRLDSGAQIDCHDELLRADEQAYGQHYDYGVGFSAFGNSLCVHVTHLLIFERDTHSTDVEHPQPTQSGRLLAHERINHRIHRPTRRDRA